MYFVRYRMNKQLAEGVSKIKSIARDVYRQLGSGFSEVVYDRAMQVGLRLAGFRYENQRVVELRYRGHYVGEGYPDLIVHIGSQRVVVELKAISGDLGPPEEQQVRNYLRHLKLGFGLLINFQYPPYRREAKTRLEIREVEG